MKDIEDKQKYVVKEDRGEPEVSTQDTKWTTIGMVTIALLFSSEDEK